MEFKSAIVGLTHVLGSSKALITQWKLIMMVLVGLSLVETNAHSFR